MASLGFGVWGLGFRFTVVRFHVQGRPIVRFLSMMSSALSHPNYPQTQNKAHPCYSLPERGFKSLKAQIRNPKPKTLNPKPCT